MKKPPKLGATGDFPKGRLDADDEGGLNIAVTHDDDVVRVIFGTPTTWVGLPPEEALAFASLIVRHAMALKAEQTKRAKQHDQGPDQGAH